MEGEPAETPDPTLLYLQRPNEPLVAGCVAQVDGALDVDELARRIAERLARHPRFGQRPVRGAVDDRRPVWGDDPRFDVRRHLRRATVVHRSDGRPVQEQVDRFLGAPLDPERPLWDVSVVDVAPGRGSVVLLRVHQCLCNGGGSARLLDELLLDPSPVGRAEHAGGANAEPDAGRARRSGRRAIAPTAATWARDRDVERLTDRIASLREPTRRPAVSDRLSARRRVAWRTFALRDVAAICDAAQCSAADVFLALAAGALRHYLTRGWTTLEDSAIGVVLPLPADAGATAHALAPSPICPTLPLGIADPDARLNAIARETRRLADPKAAGASALPGGARRMVALALQEVCSRVRPDPALFDATPRALDGRGATRSLLGRRVDALLSIAPLLHEMAIGFAFTCYADCASVSAIVDAQLVPDPEILEGALATAFRELCTVGQAPPLAALATTRPARVRPGLDIPSLRSSSAALASLTRASRRRREGS
ncbi:MAG TPA: wax ester/triacylglycerol synthase domain-containing protein [Candidatus Binatia bacterium]|nr:wax ester/triacylglycerol synthase domain-containing protein [Candidatus Binatia bacterium]